MKKICTAALALSLCFALLIPAAAAGSAIGFTPRAAMATNNMIVVSNSTNTPDAHVVHPAVYKIEGDNFFRLRDLVLRYTLAEIKDVLVNTAAFTFRHHIFDNGDTHVADSTQAI